MDFVKIFKIHLELSQRERYQTANYETTVKAIWKKHKWRIVFLYKTDTPVQYLDYPWMDFGTDTSGSDSH